MTKHSASSTSSLYGHTPHNPFTFRRALPFPQVPAAGPVYFVEDEEIDFDRVLREEKIALPKGVSWMAHWLAVEGMQLLIPENPPAIPRETVDAEGAKGESLTKLNGTGFLPTPTAPHGAKAAAAAHETGVVTQTPALLCPPHFVAPPSVFESHETDGSASQSVTQCGFTGTLALPRKVGWRGRSRYPKRRLTKRDRWAQVLFDMTSTLLENNTLFIEPYVSPPFPHHLTPTNQSTAPPNLPPNLLHPPCP